MHRARGALCVVCFGCALAAAAPAAAAETYPARPIRILATTTPGSGPDIMSRLIGQKITETLGQQVVVDNRAGASGIIGTEIAARAAPDGYTLLMLTASHVIVAETFGNLAYDLERDFAPVSLLGTTPFVVTVHPGVGASTLKELIALARAKPGALHYGSGGTGTPPHLATEILKNRTGIDLVHVPYKGITPALTDTAAGQVQLTIAVIPAALPFIKTGRLRALAVTGGKRSPLVPELPAVAETVPGYEFLGWYGLVVPARTPAPIIAKLNAVAVKAVHSPELRDKIAGLGAEPLGSTPGELGAHLRAERERLRQAVKTAGLRRE